MSITQDQLALDRMDDDGFGCAIGTSRPDEPRPLAEVLAEAIAAQRLEYLRGELRAQQISYGELAELQNLAAYIEPGDTELLEPAGVPEYAGSAP